jgi:hypothetical protein
LPLGIEQVETRFGGLWLDLNTKEYSTKSLDYIMNDGWRITKQKISKDLEQVNNPRHYEDILEHYGT